MKLQFYQYQLPFGRPFETGHGNFNNRRGFLLQLQKKDISAWGEAAPLPGFSKETLGGVRSQLKERRTDMLRLFSSNFGRDDVTNFCREYNILPSLQFALFTVCSLWQAQFESKSIQSHLAKNAADCIAVNAVIDLNRHDLVRQVRQAVSAGFQTIKIKVRNTCSLIHDLKQVRSNHPDIALRLDANRCWSFKEAADFLSRVEPLDIEYCEEPLLHPKAETLTKLQQTTGVPLALDESLIQTFPLKEAAKITRVLIIKPMMMGIAENGQTLSSLASVGEVKLVFTTSLESGVGRLMTAALAAASGSGTTAHGLATGGRLALDVWKDEPFVREGTFSMPAARTMPRLMQIDINRLQLKEIFVG